VEDPDRKPVRREGAQVSRGEVGDLLLGESERDAELHARERGRGPGPGAHGQRAAFEDRFVGTDLDMIGVRDDLKDRRILQEGHPEGEGTGDVGGVGAPDVEDARLGLVQAARSRPPVIRSSSRPVSFPRSRQWV
jgi:hypothetical protein